MQPAHSCRLSQRALVIGCFSKLTPFMRPDVRIFYTRPPPPWEANREIVSPISRRSLTPRFRDNLIEGEASSSTTLDNNIDDQPSQQKSVGEACSIFVASILLLLFACPVSFIIIYLIGKVNKRGGWWYRDF